MNNLLDLAPEALLITALILYPKMVELLIRKVAQKQINMNLKQSHFTGYQAKTWTEILQHVLFVQIGEDYAGEHNYTWVLSNEEKAKLSQEKQDEILEETLYKMYQIFVSRSFTLFSPDHILL